MLLSNEEAQRIFASLPDELKIPSLSPEYVLADALRDSSLSPLFWLYREDDVFLYHPFHMAAISETCYRDIQSAYGYGGPVATSEDAGFLTRADVAFQAWCKQENIIAGFFRFHPLLRNCRFFRGEIMKDRTTVWIDLQLPDLFASYKPRHRTEIRAIQREEMCLSCTKLPFQIENFYEAYIHTMKLQNAKDFYFLNMECVSRIIQLENALFLTLWKHDVLLSGGIFLHSGNMMEYHLSGATSEGRVMSATKLLIHKAAEWGKSRGFSFLHLGGGYDSSENNVLLFFKKRFSNNISIFKIGKQIYSNKIYDDIKLKWKSSNNTESDKVLFYRF